jgi:hypothetical protein
LQAAVEYLARLERKAKKAAPEVGAADTATAISAPVAEQVAAIEYEGIRVELPSLADTKERDREIIAAHVEMARRMVEEIDEERDAVAAITALLLAEESTVIILH